MDAVVDLQLLGSTRENLVGRLGARRERRELRGVGLSARRRRVGVWLLLLLGRGLKPVLNLTADEIYKNQVTRGSEVDV